MAKKKAKAKAQIATKGKPGFKQCSSCKKYVGPRTRVCECGHKFMRKEKVAKKKVVGKPPAAGVPRDSLDAALAFVRQTGSLEAAREALTRLGEYQIDQS
ncbi:MAG: hypothetical protein ABIK89_12330 [Planctomycetota bacterium]